MVQVVDDDNKWDVGVPERNWSMSTVCPSCYDVNIEDARLLVFALLGDVLQVLSQRTTRVLLDVDHYDGSLDSASSGSVKAMKFASGSTDHMGESCT